MAEKIKTTVKDLAAKIRARNPNSTLSDEELVTQAFKQKPELMDKYDIPQTAAVESTRDKVGRLIGGAASVYNPLPTLKTLGTLGVGLGSDVLGAVYPFDEQGNFKAPTLPKTREAVGDIASEIFVNPITEHWTGEDNRPAAVSALEGLPVFGPMLEDIGETAHKGDVMGAVGKSLGVLSPWAWGKFRKYGINSPARLEKQAQDLWIGGVAPKGLENVASAQDIAKEALNQDLWARSLPRLDAMVDARRKLKGKEIGAELDKLASDPANVVNADKLADIPERLTKEKTKYEGTDLTVGRPEARKAREYATFAKDVENLRKEFGDDIPLKPVVVKKRSMMGEVKESGGYKHAPTARPASAVAAEKDIVAEINKILNDEYPDFKKLNEEYGVLAQIQDLTGQKALLQSASGPSKVGQGLETGFMAGAIGRTMIKPLVSLEIAKWVQGLRQSPGWKMWRAHHKHELAKAIASGDRYRMVSTLLLINKDLEDEGDVSSTDQEQ